MEMFTTQLLLNLHFHSLTLSFCDSAFSQFSFSELFLSMIVFRRYFVCSLSNIELQAYGRKGA